MLTDTFLNYLKIGFEHVLPLGYDHVMFIVALFFFNSSLKSACIQCTIFTISHSLTLVLVALGYINFNANFIEIMISISIFVMAVENIFQHKLYKMRFVLVFIFGLLHGMGFASALSQIGTPQNDFMTALLSFNIGVELAQICIIIFCYYGIAKWFINKPYFQLKIANTISTTIACFAFFLIINRILE